jgi:hypothetical protein
MILSQRKVVYPSIAGQPILGLACINKRGPPCIFNVLFWNIVYQLFNPVVLRDFRNKLSPSSTVGLADDSGQPCRYSLLYVYILFLAGSYRRPCLCVLRFLRPNPFQWPTTSMNINSSIHSPTFKRSHAAKLSTTATRVPPFTSISQLISF